MALNLNPNVFGLQSNRNLWKANNAIGGALEKLSSGLRVNTAKDNPAGLVISELLRSQIGGYERALRNTQETNNVMSIAEGGLSSVSSMLTRMKSLAVHALNQGITSSGQVSADQTELNSLLSSINRVVNTTSYAGSQLLNGAQAFTFAANDPHSMLDSASTNINMINGMASGGVNIDFAGAAAGAAQAERAYLEADFGSAVLSQAQEFTIAGGDGSRTFSFSAGAGIAEMAETINSLADSTGVNAYAVRNEGSGETALRLVSSEYGSGASVQVRQIAGDAFAGQGGTAVDYGQDAELSINGQAVTTSGLAAAFQTAGGVSGSVAFNAGAAGATTIAQTGYDQDVLTAAAAGRSARINNIAGGMRIQLGEGAGGQNRETISIGNYNPGQLGRVTAGDQSYSLNDLFGGGSASLANNPEMAVRVIDQAIADVAAGRAGIGAYQANALDANANNLMVSIENLTASESSIRDADMAAMVTELVTAQLLQRTGMFGVQSSNQNRQNVMQLLMG